MNLPNDITVSEGPAATPTTEEEKKFYERGYVKDVNVSITSEAVDSVSARYAASQRLNDLFASLNLYGVEEEFQPKVDDALVRMSDGQYQIVPPTQARLGYLRNAKGIHWKAEKLLQVHGHLKHSHPEDAAQLMAALHYHRLSLTATSDEARLVNLWVALESLCQQGGDSIINRVCSKTSPCVASGNVRKILVSMAIYVRFFWDETSFDDFHKLFPNASRTDKRSSLPIEDLLAILLKPADSPELKQLFALVGSHPLLCHRLFRVKKRMLNESQSVAKSMTIHAKNIDWQLRRIYRVRNAIVHRGRSVPYLRQLIQHLHSYVVNVLQTLIYELTRHSEWGIEDALEHRRLIHERAKASLRAAQPISVSTLLNVSDILRVQKTPLAWETPDNDG